MSTTHPLGPRADPTPAPTTPTEENPWGAVVSVVTTVAPALSVVTGLLAYFGWARSDQQARVMGLDVSLFGYSTQDHVQMSVSSLYLPLLVMSAVALGWLALHWRVVARLQSSTRHRSRYGRFGRVLLIGGLTATLLAFAVACLDSTGVPLLLPLVIAAGTTLARYGAWLVEAAGATRRAVPAWQRATRSLLTGGIIALALFWQVSVYAHEVVGAGYAYALEDGLASRPRATAYSLTPLGIDAPGVSEVAVPSPAGDGSRSSARRGCGCSSSPGASSSCSPTDGSPGRAQSSSSPTTARSAGSSETEGLTPARL
jgi:hypothetical protein